MTFAPLNLMMDRVCRHGADSDTALFTELLYAGEFVLKFTVAAFVSAIEDDRESHRYRLLHGIVRADGVGEWAGALDEALSGTATQQLSPALFEARKVFTERLGKGTWQHEAVCSLHEVLRSVYDGTQSIGDRVALRAWFQMFAELRNKTRGHGAITPAMCAKLAPKLNESVRLLCTHNPIFALPWAYLHRNLSGKYRVAEFGNESDVFNKLKSAAAADGENYSDGIYLWAGRFRQVDLVYTNLDISDFFFPNGAFRNGTYELHSLISDSRLKGNAGPYQAAASERPPSETEGKGELDALGPVEIQGIPTTTASVIQAPKGVCHGSFQLNGRAMGQDGASLSW